MRVRLTCGASHTHWRSGFFDGDGSVFVSKSGSTHSPVLSVGQTSSAVAAETLSQFHGLYGGSLSEAHPDNPHNRRMRKWEVSGRAVFPALEDLGGGLIIKRPQADVILASSHLFAGKKGARVGDALRQARHELQLAVRRVRSHSRSATLSEEYGNMFRIYCASEEQKCAYAAGFCDADGCYTCVADRGGSKTIYRYRVNIVQKNRQFLEAFKQVILAGRGTNVHSSSCGMSSLSITARSQVQDFCHRVRPFSITKACQLDVILSEPPSARSKDILASMHGNQGKTMRQKTRIMSSC